MARKIYIKLVVEQMLHGKDGEFAFIRTVPYDFRWPFIQLLLMAGDSPVLGSVCIARDVPFTREQIIAFSGIPEKIYDSAMEYFRKEKMVKISDTGIIKIVNFEKYQSDYDRIKKYDSQKPEAQKRTDGDRANLMLEYFAEAHKRLGRGDYVPNYGTETNIMKQVTRTILSDDNIRDKIDEFLKGKHALAVKHKYNVYSFRCIINELGGENDRSKFKFKSLGV